MKLHLFALFGFLCLCAFSLHAQEIGAIKPSTPDVKTALTQVVTQQLAAFAAGDFNKAYTFAAPEIHQIFPPVMFEKMVRANYGVMLLKPKTDFGVTLDDGQNGVAFVELTVDNGDVQIFRYSFKKGPRGWKISGVEQVEKARSGPPPLSA